MAAPPRSGYGALPTATRPLDAVHGEIATTTVVDTSILLGVSDAPNCALRPVGPGHMIAVELEDGTTIYAFGRSSVLARDAAGAPDSHWQSVAESSLAGAGGDLRAALTGLPGARLIHEGPVRPPTITPSRGDRPDDESAHTVPSEKRR